MGASSSKVTGKAAAAAGRRQYPSTASILHTTSSTSNAPGLQAKAPPSAVRPNPRDAPPSEAKSEHIDLDGRDPQFGSNLRALGPAMPVAHTRSQHGAFPMSLQPALGQQAGGKNVFPGIGGRSTVTNPAIVVVDARERIEKVWEQEQDAFGRGSFAGRTMLSAGELAEMIQMRDDGMVDREIEKKMRLSGDWYDAWVLREWLQTFDDEMPADAASKSNTNDSTHLVLHPVYTGVSARSESVTQERAENQASRRRKVMTNRDFTKRGRQR